MIPGLTGRTEAGHEMNEEVTASKSYHRSGFNQELRDLEQSAIANLTSIGRKYSRRSLARELVKRAPRSDLSYSQRLSEWLGHDERAKRPNDFAAAWATVCILQDLAGQPDTSRTNRAHWDLLWQEAETPSRRAVRPRENQMRTIIGEPKPRRIVLAITLILALVAGLVAASVAWRLRGATSTDAKQITTASIFTDDFSDSTTWITSWLPGRDPQGGFGAGADVRDGSGFLTTSNKQGYENRISRRIRAETLADVAIQAKFRLEDGCIVTMFARADSALNAQRGYAVFLQPGAIFIEGKDNWETTFGNAGADVPIAINKWYSVRFVVDGEILRARIWPAEKREPEGWAIDVEDGSVQGAGAVGISVGDLAGLSCTVAVDDVRVTAI